jgi:hypothetical protein
MADQPETSSRNNIQSEIAELVRSELIRAGALQDLEEKLKAVVERASKITLPSPDRERPLL